jgi:hypothetical protein
MKKNEFKSLIKECIEESLVENLSEGRKKAKKKDKKWIQKSVNPKHKGYCTPTTKKTCNPHRKALAKRFKKGIKENVGGVEYHSIVFMQGDDAKEALNIFNENGTKAAIKHLSQWDYGHDNEHSPYDKPPWGSNDRIFKDGSYVLVVNQKIGYIGLVRVESVNEEDDASLQETSGTGAVQGFFGKNWVGTGAKGKHLAKKSMPGGGLA